MSIFQYCVDNICFNIDAPLFYSIDVECVDNMYEYCIKRTEYDGVIAINDVEYSDIPMINSPISIVPKSLCLYPYMDVYKGVRLGLDIHQEPKDEIEHENCILEYLHRIPKKLGFVQLRGVAMFRAFTRYPSIVIMDDIFDIVEDDDCITSLIQLIDKYSIPVLYLNRSHNKLVDKTSLSVI